MSENVRENQVVKICPECKRPMLKEADDMTVREKLRAGLRFFQAIEENGEIGNKRTFDERNRKL